MKTASQKFNLTEETQKKINTPFCHAVFIRSYSQYILGTRINLDKSAVIFIVHNRRPKTTEN